MATGGLYSLNTHLSFCSLIQPASLYSLHIHIIVAFFTENYPSIIPLSHQDEISHGPNGGKYEYQAVCKAT